MTESSRPVAEPASPVLNATRARQGRVGTGLVWVLIFGTLLAAIGLFVAWTIKAPSLASTNSDNGRVSTSAPAFNTPAPAPVTPLPTPTKP
ncbi:hypothetical protein [Phenylobacterium sp.]|uniref:hypothetical protein n=1 Tax=Phenylobacterium sp. TaxID=1871053 RepID=UPI003566F551